MCVLLAICSKRASLKGQNMQLYECVIRLCLMAAVYSLFYELHTMECITLKLKHVTQYRNADSAKSVTMLLC